MDTNGTIDQASLVTITIAFLFLAGFLLFIFILYRIRRNRHIRDEENMKRGFSEALMQTRLEIQEQTLKNISQEIHDNIGQVLSLAKLNLFTMDTSNSVALDQKINNSKELVSKAITDLRHLSHSLNTDYIEKMGLLRAIEYELELISKSGNIRTALEITGAACKIERKKELIIFRIIQEVLSNALKHAEADCINVKADFAEAVTCFEISDDGKGISDISIEENPSSGIGIKNIQERARMIGGEISINGLKGKGTTVLLKIPKSEICL